MRNILLTLFLVTMLGSCQPDRAESSEAPPTRSMKGYELYSWQTSTPRSAATPWPTTTPTTTSSPTPYCRPSEASGKVISVYDDLYVRDGYSYPVTTIAVASEDVWVGFGDYSSQRAGGGVWRYDGEEWEVFTQAEGFPVSDNVQVLMVAPDDSVWAGAGCQVARFADGVWEEMADCETLRGNVIDIAFTPDGATWVASALKLSRFDGQTWMSYGKLAHHLAVGPDGALWVSGWEGLQTSFYVARFGGTDWTTYNMTDLLGHGVGKIAVTPDGDVWGTAGEKGIVRYDGQTWRHYTDAEGLPSNEVRELVVGPDGVLWAMGDEGLVYFDGDRWIRVAHKSMLGGTTLAFGQDGTMWVGTSDVMIRLRP
jgi:ligand-binding sensor domain-containing protein